MTLKQKKWIRNFVLGAKTLGKTRLERLWNVSVSGDKRLFYIQLLDDFKQIILLNFVCQVKISGHVTLFSSKFLYISSLQWLQPNQFWVETILVTSNSILIFNFRNDLWYIIFSGHVTFFSIKVFVHFFRKKLFGWHHIQLLCSTSRNDSFVGEKSLFVVHHIQRPCDAFFPSQLLF